MEYQKYIDLGFTRFDMNCSVEFKRTGYRGYSLEKKISDRQMICVSSGDLDNPKLYIRRRGKDTYHIIPISPEAVVDLCSDDSGYDYMYTCA